MRKASSIQSFFSESFSALIYRAEILINRGLHHWEVSTSLGRDDKLRYPPIFIIGAPRSGSTLLYQVLIDHYDIGYISNLHAKFFGSPAFLESLIHPLMWRQPSSYTSYHGKTQGWTEPSECGEFWYRFFRHKPQYVPLEEAETLKMYELRNSVRALLNAFGKPVLFKNMNCALRLQPTAKILPEALFIVIHRNLIDNAHSLLSVRKKVYGDYMTWWSMEPPNISHLIKLPPEQQVVEQICHIYELIYRDSLSIGKNRFLELSYESLCQDPHGIIEEVNSFFDKHNLKIKKRDSNPVIPAYFHQSDQLKIDKKLYSRLVNYAEKK